MTSLNARNTRFAYKLLVPAIILTFLVHIIPTLWGIYISFRKLNVYYIRNWTEAPFIGFANYTKALSSLQGVFWSSLCYTLIFVIASVLGCFILGILGAVLLNENFKGRNVIRGILLIPYILPGVVSLTNLRFMLLQDWGIINSILLKIGLISEPISWLTGKMALISIIIGNIWIRWPLWFITILASLQSIPGELYEAAKVDGASDWQGFRRITLPSVSPTITVLTVLTALWSFNNFTVPFILTGGSPSKEANILSLNIWIRSFKNWDFGMGAAMSVVMMLIMLVLILTYLKLTKLEEEQ
ncbi:MAG: multiple sugar transport system permease protein [Kosmotoga sp.]|nr:multiple sugar transport system permease protein [Kosmotoga sp.]